MARDKERVLSLWGKYYGGTPNEAMLDAAVSGENDRTAGFAGMVGQTLVGFGIASVAPLDWINSVYDIDAEPHVSHKLNGLLYQSVVEPTHRGRGIGTTLTHRRLHWLAAHEVDLYHVLAVCWVREDGRDARSIVERFGLESVEYIEREPDPDHWCPDCGEGCDCDAELYLATWGDLEVR